MPCCKYSTLSLNTVNIKLTVCELFLEVLDLFLELSQEGVLWILVNLGLVLDVLGAVGVAQRADRLVVVVLCWPNVGALRITSEKQF